jgi:hypothetical protein
MIFTHTAITIIAIIRVNQNMAFLIARWTLARTDFMPADGDLRNDERQSWQAACRGDDARHAVISEFILLSISQQCQIRLRWSCRRAEMTEREKRTGRNDQFPSSADRSLKG